MYFYTNEILPAIIAGLDLRSNDNVFAICGSGDQAIAILEYVDNVIAVDYSKNQLEYAIKRAKLIKDGKFNDFFNYQYDTSFFKYGELRKEYFMKKGRMDKIKDKISKLEFRHANLNKLRKFSPYSRLYLSNAVSYSGNTFYDDSKLLHRILNSVEDETNIYVTSGIPIERVSDKTDLNNKVNKKLSKKAACLEITIYDRMTFVPIVFTS